jgi:hypothetical protein
MDKGKPIGCNEEEPLTFDQKIHAFMADSTRVHKGIEPN